MKIGLAQDVQLKGYFLAYVIPPVALVFGAIGGHLLGAYVDFPPLESILGFVSLFLVSFFSFRRLRRLDASHSIEIVDIS